MMQWLAWVFFGILIGVMLALVLSCTKVVVNTGEGQTRESVISIEPAVEVNPKDKDGPKRTTP